MIDQNMSPEKTHSRKSLSRYLRTWSITRRLIINSLFSIFSFILVILIFGTNARTIYSSFDKLVNQSATDVRRSNDVRASILALFNETREFALTKEESTLLEVEASLANINTNMVALVDASPTVEAKNLAELQDSFLEMESQIEETISLIQSDTDPETITEAFDKLENLEQSILALLETINNDLQDEAERIGMSITRRIASTVGIMLGTTILLLVGNLMFSHFSAQSILKPLDELKTISLRIASGELSLEADDESNDEIGVLATAFNQMNTQVRELILSEADISEKLKRNLTQIHASNQVTQVVTSILDPSEIIENVVNLIQAAFNFYYVGIFTTDDLGEWAILRSGSGEAGRAMLERGHRIKIGEGMIGWCIANAKARVAREVGEDAVRLATEELPDTRSEAAIPLRSREQVLGALTVQDDKPGIFDEETLNVLQNMADQVAIALDNAHLFAESRAALEASRRAYGEISQEAWKEFLGSRPDIDYISTPQREVKNIAADWDSDMAETYTVGQITRPNNDTVNIPIILRDQTLGIVRMRKREESGAWSDDEIELMDTLVNQLETALESARLYSDTQLQAQRERLTAEITDRLHRALDIDLLMQTMIREISTALGADSAFIQLSTTTPENEAVGHQTISPDN